MVTLPGMSVSVARLLVIAGGLALSAAFAAPGSAQQPPPGQPQAAPVPTNHPLTTDFKSRFYLVARLGYAHVNGRIQDYQEGVLANNWNSGFGMSAAAGFSLARFL